MRSDAETAQGSETTAPARVALGELLVAAELVSQPEVQMALAEGTQTGERLGEVLVRKGIVTEDDVARLLAQQWGLDYVERSSIWFDSHALARLAREDAQRLEVLPTRVEDGRVVVAVAEPTEGRLQALRELIGEETIVIVVPKSALDAGLRSDLLRSARREASAPEEASPAPEEVSAAPESEADQVEPVAKDVAARRSKTVTDRAVESAALASVTPLRVRRKKAEPADDPDDDADAAALDADEGQAIAERLAEQVAAIRAEQQELRATSQQYESHIDELEHELDRRTEELDQRTEELNQRTEELNQRTEELDELRSELDRRVEQLERIRNQLTALADM
ncbi:MAG: GspE/PulE/PilB domain-containing protein [Gaiellaceae bacterium]